MKVFDNGSFFSVTVSKADIHAFKSQYPCSGIPSDISIWFQFSKANGDLVDIEPSTIDGPGVLALAQDAQNYGAKKLGLSELAYRR